MDRSRLAAPPRVAATLALAACLALAPRAAHALIPNCTACTPPGWSAPIVVRSAGDAVDSLAVTMPATLEGRGTFWFNWASCGNAAAIGGWTDRLELDGAPLETLVRPVDTRWISHYFRAVNQGPTVIRGGRHTLSMEADVFYESGEASTHHSDNLWSGQWVWSPEPRTWSGVYHLAAPPARGGGALPNCDASAFTRPAGAAWCVGIGSAGDDDLLVYDDYTDATNGLSHLLAASASGSTGVEFVVGHGAGTPATLYPGVTGGTAGAPATYALSTSDATTRSGNATSLWGGVLFPGGRIGEAYSVHLEGGTSVSMTLPRNTVAPGLGVAVFPAAAGGAYAREQALVGSAAIDAQTERLVFTAPATGDYPVIVFRRTAEGLFDSNVYNLELSTTVGVSGAVPAPALDLGGAVPNPANVGARFAFSLPRAGRVTLTLHDVQGRRLRTLMEGDLPAGGHEAAWDGRDDAGAPASPGAYWVELRTADGRRTRPLAFTR